MRARPRVPCPRGGGWRRSGRVGLPQRGVPAVLQPEGGVADRFSRPVCVWRLGLGRCERAGGGGRVGPGIEDWGGGGRVKGGGLHIAGTAPCGGGTERGCGRCPARRNNAPSRRARRDGSRWQGERASDLGAAWPRPPGVESPRRRPRARRLLAMRSGPWSYLHGWLASRRRCLRPCAQRLELQLAGCGVTPQGLKWRRHLRLMPRAAPSARVDGEGAKGTGGGRDLVQQYEEG